MHCFTMGALSRHLDDGHQTDVNQSLPVCVSLNITLYCIIALLGILVILLLQSILVKAYFSHGQRR